MKKILLVDDDPKIRALLQATIGGRYKIIEAGDGRETIEKVKKEKPSLIILDVLMPNMDGFEVCRIIKNDPELIKIPVILLTAKKDPEDRRRGIEAGCDEYFTKPFSPRALLKRIEELLEE